MSEKGLLGIIGGVGPYAGLDTFRALLDASHAERDQDYPDLIVASCPSRIPDRTRWLLNREGPNPAYGLYDSAKRLYDAGVRTLMIACNTTHAQPIFSVLSALVSKELPELDIVHLIQTCADHIVRDTTHKKIGLLATKGTHANKVYEQAFSRYPDITLLVPNEALQASVMEAIYSPNFGIKTFSSPVHAEAIVILKEAVHALKERGAEAVILGCTELVLALPHADIPLVNPVEIAVKTMLEKVR